ncbi:hypothetical protein KP509_09G004400 [Ceratopteris richardii]|uniref:BZIP domain-containing protein n=1 Tax=Ceratopteris richardii TaxID=49495 RepID=A0A8T2U4R7_CERRI|nr:hypothetical protein KP509_09G004400 [Ceratopteris richardii]
MARLLDGDSRGFERGPNGITSRLPPRIPPVPGKGLVPSDLGTGIFHAQRFENFNKVEIQQNQTTSFNTFMHEQPDWFNGLLDSENSSKKSSHRRSASDSFAFLENAESSYMFDNTIGEGQNLTKLVNSSVMNKNCLAGLLDEILISQDQRNAPISAVTKPISRGEFLRIDEITDGLHTMVGSTLSSNFKTSLVQSLSLSEKTCFESSDQNSQDNGANDATADPKKAKRQSAQRSRVRKLQYIAQLEEIVNSLQMQVSSLSPQLLLFQRQCSLLAMKNNALKQKIALCMREKSIKDSQNETLSSERERLQRLYEIKALNDSQTQQPPNRIHRHSSLPADIEAHLHHYNELTKRSKEPVLMTSSQETFSDVIEDFTGLCLLDQSGIR